MGVPDVDRNFRTGLSVDIALNLIVDSRGLPEYPPVGKPEKRLEAMAHVPASNVLRFL